jgi:hypothetical protein
MQSKTFRLFISSTFSDFNEERRLLQTYVFPKVKDYCSGKGYTFQPIDLRWGVSNEAQLDQKTLELCINEVHASKLQPHPNFLIMAGDRYGWVSCPYAIEEEEFKAIKKQVKATDEPLTIEYKEYKVKDSNACETGDKGSFDEQDNNKIFKPNDSQTTKIELLEKWYKLDENQIPPSYILQERVNNEHSCYESYQYWEAEENALREILQTAVELTSLDVTSKEKYFDSATEQEVFNGIIKYKDKTPQQDELINKNKDYEFLDESHVYGYIRSITTVESSEPEADTEFFDKEDLQPRISDFKQQLRDSIKNDNLLEVDADLTNFSKDEKNKSLNYEYDSIGTKSDEDSEKESEFVKGILTRLKRSVDDFDKHIASIGLDEPEAIEIESQRVFKEDKAKGFVGREGDLKAIQSYIESDNNQALVIYGPSGMGKSALMAKAIEQTEDKHKDKQKVIYRFVASTASLSTSVEVLISILKELGIEESIQITKDDSGQDKPEDLDQFFARLSGHLSNLTESTTIFIDAVDQFTNKDALEDGYEFIWLPKQLPDNLKIVISALEDDKYKEDSKYLELLKTKISNQDNLHKLEPFNGEHAKEMIDGILGQYKRSITPEQQSYLFEQSDSKQPLYLSIAAQELKHWKSTDITKAYQTEGEGQDLAPTQREVIDEYIQNLTELYHHDQDLIHRVTSYLHLTDGLSESELLEILSTDEDFIDHIAPDTYHNKTEKTLPVVIWARLHSQLKSFLKLEGKDGQEIMGFFHREFDSAVAEQDYIQQTHKHLISLVVELMKKNKDSSFESNRYGKIYIGLVVKYFEKYHSDASTGAIDILEVSGKKLAQIHSWEYLHSLANWMMNSSLSPTTSLTIAFVFLMGRFKDNLKMVEVFEEVSNSLINTHITLNTYDAANDFARNFANSLQKLYLEDRSKWLCKYIESLSTFSKTLLLAGDPRSSLGVINHAIDSYKGIPLEAGQCNSSYFYVLIQAAAVYSKNADYDLAIEFSKKAIELASIDHKSDKNEWDVRCVEAIGLLASIKMNTSSPMEDLLELRDEAVSRSGKLFNLDNEKYISVYVKSILGMARTLSCNEYFYSSDYSLIKIQKCNNIDPAKAYYSKLSTVVALKAKEVMEPFFKKSYFVGIGQYGESLMIPINNLINTCQNGEALKFVEILLADIEPGKGIPAVDQMDLDLRQKKIRIYAGEGDRDKAYELYENVYQDLYDKYDEENTTSLEALLKHLIGSSEIFSEFKDWDSCKKYLSLAKKMCALRFKGNPDLWQRQYVEILYNYCGLLFTRFDKRLSYEVAIELNDILVRYGIHGVSENTLVDRVIDEFKSTDAEYLLEQHQKNELEHYESQLEEYLKAQELEYLDELSKTILSNDNIKEIVDQEIERLGNNANLNHLNVSAITKMNELFKGSNFNGDISNWDVSNVKDMSSMFENSLFDRDISSWNIDDKANTVFMYKNCPISKENKGSQSIP